MDMNHDHDHSMMDHGNMGNMTMGMHWTHMTFFWGSHSEILFSGWPGARTGMYVLALILVFVFSVMYEWLNHCALIKKSEHGNLATGLVQTTMHTVRVVLMYLIMLAIMSFNVGVLIVAVAGHAVGFFLFGGRGREKEADLPPMAC